MLQIKEIRKQYITGELVQTALDGVSLNLRDNEFVAILGPSGSGKTTLLNVIGGLDRYDSGDLIINGISTKKYTDRDWDSYRNHTIGFVFQSYNLIPHQTVLANVELALTISGISRAQRRKRAVKALEDVGLGNQLHKRPNQMSGGQMQRVAIARALVNNPDILLADEPTGALDSETSIQVMELLKEVSKERLVVMVTHNPELAEAYANRIVRVRDGRILGDTNPYTPEEADAAPPAHRNMGKASMSFLTALSLSFNNLRTKKARTLLTAFAGSIGIIGIALIMALSTGFQRYIDKIQADTLSNYPLTIQSETADMGSAFAAVGASISAAAEAEPGEILEQQMITQMFAQIGTNDLGAFKAHLEAHWQEIGHTVNAVKYSYGVKPRIYAARTEDGVLQVNPGTLFSDMMGQSMMTAYMDMDIFQEMIDNIPLLDSQYEILQGRWPERYDEMVVVLSDAHQITDYMAYTVGMKDVKSLHEMIDLVMNGKKLPSAGTPMEWTYDDLMALEFRLVSVPDLYRYNAEYDVWEDMSQDEAFMKTLVDNGELLRVVGIVCPKEGVSAAALSPGIAYRQDLTAHIIETASKAEIVKKQREDPEKNVFTGVGFDEETEQSLRFEDMITVDSDAISSAFGMNISSQSVVELMKRYLNQAAAELNVDTTPAQKDFCTALGELSREMLEQYVLAHGDASGVAKIHLTEAETIVDEYLAGEQAAARISALAKAYALPGDAFTQVYRPLLTGLITSYVAQKLVSDAPDTAPVLPTVSAEEVRAAAALMKTEAASTEPAPAPMEPTPAPTEAVAAPTEPAPAPTEAVAVPTEPTPAPTEAVAAPTEPVPAPTEAVSVPTEPAPAPTEAAAVPTEPAPAPTEVVPTSTEPTAAPTEPAAVPTEPVPGQPVLDPNQFYAELNQADIAAVVAEYLENPVVTGTAAVMGTKMMENTIRSKLMEKMAQFGKVLSDYIGKSIYVDGDKIASAFQFNMDEEELQRLMTAMAGTKSEKSAKANLQSLGYADPETPTQIAIYLVDFAGKEEFLDFLDGYNADMQAEGREEQVIRYTDMTGVMMSSVRIIIDSVSYALIAFVAVSLVVSSIMIGIITYISVMERTKEIGVLRAIGASKRNITQVFNAETCIIGLCSGLLGIGITLLILIPGNQLIHHLTNNPDITAQLPLTNALALVGLSVLLTQIGGFIPSKKAAKKDPVIALRTE